MKLSFSVSRWLQRGLGTSQVTSPAGIILLLTPHYIITNIRPSPHHLTLLTSLTPLLSQSYLSYYLQPSLTSPRSYLILLQTWRRWQIPVITVLCTLGVRTTGRLTSLCWDPGEMLSLPPAPSTCSKSTTEGSVIEQRISDNLLFFLFIMEYHYCLNWGISRLQAWEPQ